MGVVAVLLYHAMQGFLVRHMQTLAHRFSEAFHQRVRNKFIETSNKINGLLTDAQEKITKEDVKDWFDAVQDVLHEAEDLLDEIHCEDRRLQVKDVSRSRSNMIQNFFSSLLTCGREDSIKVMEGNLKRIFRKIKELKKQGRSSLGLRIIQEDQVSFWRRRGPGDGAYERNRNLSYMKSRYREFEPDLKRCFLYCAVFPKGYCFRREELVLLWLANGFLDFPCSPFSTVSKTISSKRERGYNYFQDLVRSSVFVKPSDDSPYFILHEGMYDLAKSISENYGVSLDDGDSLSRNTRHIWCRSSISRYEDLANLMTNMDGARMRTILPISNESFWEDINDAELGSLLSTFKRLRVLWLPGIHELPKSIGNMKHLRYLNLSGAAVERLPESVCSLFNLQTLILRECRDLVELPADIVKLTELCHLDVRETRLQQMPPHISKLRKLETLTDFFVGEQTGCGIDELGTIRYLQGELHIWNLQNVLDALKEGLYFKRWKIKELELRWSGSGADDSLLQQHVLEALEPHTDVERLSIIGYGGKEFPDWVGRTSFSEIVDLKLSECHYCSSLPPLGQLKSLKTLVIQAFYRVEKVGSEFYGSSAFTGIPFPSLKTLTFERMLQWREWKSYGGENEDRAFPGLEVLRLRKCPNLPKISLPSHRPLVELEITKCQRLQRPLPGFPNIKNMVFGDDFHKMLLDLHLQSLAVDSFHSLDSILEEIQQWGYSCSTLQKIEITRSPLKRFPNLEYFSPESFSALKELDLSRCPNLESLRAQHFTSLERLKVTECPKLKSMLNWRLPSSLISLSMKSCPLLETELSTEYMGESAEHISPEPFSAFRELDFSRCPNLESLPAQHFTSLERLELTECPELKSMPEKTLPSSLIFLCITSCPLLKQRCQRDTGEDWSKISHIPHIWIDGHEINREV